jgi:hypothetical protein
LEHIRREAERPAATAGQRAEANDRSSR